MASGKDISGLLDYSSTVASMMPTIAEMIFRTGQAKGAGYANVGASIGGGIARRGENRREDAVRADAKAERSADREERKAERAASLAERRTEHAESLEERRLSRLALERHRQDALEVKVQTVAEKLRGKETEAATWEAQTQALSGSAPDATQPQQSPLAARRAEAAKAEAGTLQQVLQSLAGRMGLGKILPRVLKEQPDGTTQDMSDPNVMIPIMQQRFDDARAQVRKAKDPRQVAAANVILAQTERDLRGALALKQRKSMLGERRKAEQRQQATLQAGMSTAQATYGENVPPEVARFIQEQAGAGLTPSEMGTALGRQFGTGATAPKTPREKAVAAVDLQQETAAEKERRGLGAIDPAEAVERVGRTLFDESTGAAIPGRLRSVPTKVMEAALMGDLPPQARQPILDELGTRADAAMPAAGASAAAPPAAPPASLKADPVADAEAEFAALPPEQQTDAMAAKIAKKYGIDLSAAR